MLGEIKKRDQSYEERLWRLSEEISSKSNGIEFSSAQVLQFFYLLEKETTRISSSRFTANETERFLAALAHQDALIELFEGYLWGLFKINNASIVPRWLAVLPLAVYLTTWPCKNIRVTRGKVGPGRTSGSGPDRIDIETLAHVEAEHAIRSDVGVDQRR